MAVRSKTPLCKGTGCRASWRRGLDLIAKSLRKQAGSQHEVALGLEGGGQAERQRAGDRQMVLAGALHLLALALELEGLCVDCARREAQRLAAQDRAAFVENRSRDAQRSLLDPKPGEAA